MPEKKTVPDFQYVPRGPEGSLNDMLYTLEKSMSNAVQSVAKFREKFYNEDLWRCALPEAIFNILDRFQQDHIVPAICHWLSFTMNRMPRVSKEGKPPEYYRALLESCKNFVSEWEKQFGKE